MFTSKKYVFSDTFFQKCISSYRDVLRDSSMWGRSYTGLLGEIGRWRDIAPLRNAVMFLWALRQEQFPHEKIQGKLGALTFSFLDCSVTIIELPTALIGQAHRYAWGATALGTSVKKKKNLKSLPSESRFQGIPPNFVWHEQHLHQGLNWCVLSHRTIWLSQGEPCLTMRWF